MVLTNLFARQQWRHRHREHTDGQRESGGEESEMKGETSMETHTLQYVKQTASGNLRYDCMTQGSVTT